MGRYPTERAETLGDLFCRVVLRAAPFEGSAGGCGDDLRGLGEICPRPAADEIRYVGKIGVRRVSALRRPPEKTADQVKGRCLGRIETVSADREAQRRCAASPYINGSVAPSLRRQALAM